MSSAPPTDPTQTWDRPLKVQFVHGLESAPGSSKSTYLDRFFDALTPAMDTRDFEGAIATQSEKAAEFFPDVLVGSSFGGAVALAMLQRRLYGGAVVLLCPAYRHFGVEGRIPEASRVLIVHGSRDELVPLDDSKALAATGTPGLVELVVVDDEHRLHSLLEGDALATLVRKALIVTR
ncbi:MAG TPA: YqiA/YcfP family alpha/beta fold hydrolase [Polyangiaceae bacterium]|nr:YqiA/YcfP family alpha/beta fold hydrolase [Polyangiaceae bacterium]